MINSNGCCEPVIQDSNESRLLCKKLRILMGIFTILTLLKVFIVGSFFNELIIIIIAIFMLRIKSYLYAMLLIFFLMFGIFSESVFTLLLIQNGILGFGFSWFVTLFEIIFIFLYVRSTYVSFLAYKEFKALTVEQQGAQAPNNQYVEMSSQINNSGNNANQQGNRGYVAFSGQGHPVG